MLYHDTIVDRRISDNSILLNLVLISKMNEVESIMEKTRSVEVDKNGIMYVWYLDADEKYRRKIRITANYCLD